MAVKMSRNLTLRINWVLDQLVPPIIRDAKWFMYMPLNMAFKNKKHLFFNFKNDVNKITEKEFIKYYEDAESVNIERPTDLNNECIDLIMENLKGKIVLEIAVGRGYMAKKIHEAGHNVTAGDIIINDELKSNNPDIKFVETNIENMPFEDKEFDSVVCTHTLEHVLDFQAAVRELRRVGKRLIICVPKQRPYKYTFDFHVHFFPYLFSFLLAMGKKENEVTCINAGGDIFYVEDVATK